MIVRVVDVGDCMDVGVWIDIVPFGSRELWSGVGRRGSSFGKPREASSN